MMASKKKRAIESDNEDDSLDLENELLQSLGGDASRGKRAATKKPKAAWGNSDSEENFSDADWGVTTSKSKLKKSKTAGASASSKMSSEEDSSSSSEEDISEEEDSSEEDFVDAFGDDLMGDEEDREKLLAMTEMEREEILYKRGVERENKREIYLMKKQLKLSKKKEDLHKKRLEKKKQLHQEPVGKKSKGVTRGQKTTKKSSAIEELKAKRKAREEKKTQSNEVKKSRVAQIFSSDEDDAPEGRFSPSRHHPMPNSSGRYDALKETSEGPISSPPRDSNLDDLESIRISRFKLEKWIHQPFFEATVKGCFARVGIGMTSGNQVYRVAEIVGVVEGNKVYESGGVKTDKLLKVQHGNQLKSFRIQYVSNSPFTESEFSRWREEMLTSNLPLPTHLYCENKRKEIKDAMNYNYSHKDIEDIIAQKKKNSSMPTNYAVERAKIKQLIEISESKGDFSQIENLRKKYEQLLEDGKNHHVYRDRHLDAVANINKRNRSWNAIGVVEALGQNKTGTLGSSESAKDEDEGLDPFERRKCKPILVQNHLSPRLGPISKSRSPSPVKLPSPKTKSSGNPKVPLVNPSSNASGSKPSDDLFASHSFDIDIEVAPPDEKLVSAHSTLIPPISKPLGSAGISLSEYKKKRGLI